MGSARRHNVRAAAVTLAPVPVGLEETSSFSANTVALPIYLRFTHAIGYRALTQVFLHRFALHINEGALAAMLHRAKPCFDDEVAACRATIWMETERHRRDRVSTGRG